MHTISLYMNASNQEALEDYILSLQPKRIIFNPGAENPRLMKKADEADIKAFNACSLVILRMNQFFD
ncbi:MAG: CoA-binding protein [Saprospiraceae bacterium]